MASINSFAKSVTQVASLKECFEHHHIRPDSHTCIIGDMRHVIMFCVVLLGDEDDIKCGRCGEFIDGEYFTLPDGTPIHPECYICTSCKTSLAGKKFFSKSEGKDGVTLRAECNAKQA